MLSLEINVLLLLTTVQMINVVRVFQLMERCGRSSWSKYHLNFIMRMSQWVDNWHSCPSLVNFDHALVWTNNNNVVYCKSQLLSSLPCVCVWSVHFTTQTNMKIHIRHRWWYLIWILILIWGFMNLMRREHEKPLKSEIAASVSSMWHMADWFVSPCINVMIKLDNINITHRNISLLCSYYCTII